MLGVRYEKVTSPSSTLYGPLNISLVDSSSAPIARATSSADDRRGVMPRHEFFAIASGAARCEGTNSISSPTAAKLNAIICFVADIKPQIPFYEFSLHYRPGERQASPVCPS